MSNILLLSVPSVYGDNISVYGLLKDDEDQRFWDYIKTIKFPPDPEEIIYPTMFGLDHMKYLNWMNVMPAVSNLCKSFWIYGYKPVQLLEIIFLWFLVSIAINYLMKQAGKSISAFWQAIYFWMTTVFILRYVIFPQIPEHLFLNYLAVITVAIFLYFSTSNQRWEEFKYPIISTLCQYSVGNICCDSDFYLDRNGICDDPEI